jgi:hypothetical protein
MSLALPPVPAGLGPAVYLAHPAGPGPAVAE